MFGESSSSDKKKCKIHLKLWGILVRALTSFHSHIFLKSFDMLRQCLLPSITKKSKFLLVDSEPATTYSPSNTKLSLKHFNIS